MLQLRKTAHMSFESGSGDRRCRSPLAVLLAGAAAIAWILAPAAAAATAATPVAVAASPTTLWRWPVEGSIRVLIQFRAPATPYSAGHRGVDLAASLGDPVLAPAAGVVRFAGRVVNRPLVSLAHDDDLISSLEPVDPIVEEGQRVAAGQQIGWVSEADDGAASHCSDCLHFGVRRHGSYLSPLALLGGVPRAVLLPLELPPAG